jgi:ABC-type uncharacterized transport system auxiliary subunit
MKKILFAVIVVIGLASCAKEIIARKYYMLDFPVDSLKIKNVAPLTEDVLEILPVQVTEVYAQHRIAVRKRSHEITYYHYHQWGESPDQSIARLTESRLQVANLFADVSERIWNTSPRYQLQTFVERMEAVEGDDSLFAHVKIKYEMFDRNRKKNIVIHEFDRSVGYEDWDINLIADGMSRILSSELGVFAEKIRQYLLKDQ